MKRTARRVFLTILLTVLCVANAVAQEQPQPTPEWVSVEPPGESFFVFMPRPPAFAEQDMKLDGQDVRARIYTDTEDLRIYMVLSLPNPWPAEAWSARGSAWLDACAESAWELLVRPLAERMREDRQDFTRWPSMSYRGASEGVHPGRDYDLALHAARGKVKIHPAGERVYVVAAADTPDGAAEAKKFLDSFGLKTRNSGETPATGPGAPAVPTTGGGIGLGPGRGTSTGGGDGNEGLAPGGGMPAAPSGEVDYSRPFTARDVTRKAVITYKPEPAFTESARKFSVTGTVILRALLAPDGEVRNVVIVKHLPHGLTQSAVEAARKIRFTPAEKDGRTVSQWVIFEYNFNIY